jgi:hypothetical protein
MDNISKKKDNILNENITLGDFIIFSESYTCTREYFETMKTISELVLCEIYNGASAYLTENTKLPTTIAGNYKIESGNKEIIKNVASEISKRVNNVQTTLSVIAKRIWKSNLNSLVGYNTELFEKQNKTIDFLLNTLGRVQRIDINKEQAVAIDKELSGLTFKTDIANKKDNDSLFTVIERKKADRGEEFSILVNAAYKININSKKMINAMGNYLFPVFEAEIAEDISEYKDIFGHILRIVEELSSAARSVDVTREQSIKKLESNIDELTGILNRLSGRRVARNFSLNEYKQHLSFFKENEAKWNSAIERFSSDNLKETEILKKLYALMIKVQAVSGRFIKATNMYYQDRLIAIDKLKKVMTILNANTSHLNEQSIVEIEKLLAFDIYPCQ